MSMPLDLNSFLSNDSFQKISYFDDFEKLLEISKPPFDSSDAIVPTTIPVDKPSTNIHTAKIPIQPETPTSISIQPESFLNDSSNTISNDIKPSDNTPEFSVEDQPIIIEPECFFNDTNSSINLPHTEVVPSPVSLIRTSPVSSLNILSNINNDIDEHLHSTVTITEDRVLPPMVSSDDFVLATETYTKFKENLIQKQVDGHKLFSVFHNSLQPVLSKDIKSGVYRKVVDKTQNTTTQGDPFKPDGIFNSISEIKNKLDILASDILKLPRDKYKIYREKKLLIHTIPQEHKKIIYKIVEPKLLGLRPTAKYNLINSSSSLKRKVGRPRKDESISISEIPKPSVPPPRTRSGRITKPPSYINNLAVKDLEKIAEEQPNKIDFNDLRDKDFKYNKTNSPPKLDFEKNEPPTKRIRKLPPGSQCPTCNKILLGKRMKQHFEAHPDHNIKNFHEMSLYKFLVNKIKFTTSEDNDHRTEIFLNELSDLIEQLQIRNSKLIQSTSGIHFVNTKLSKVLGIPEGQYSINVNAIHSMPDPILAVEEFVSSRSLGPPPPRLDYNLSISLDDTITAKLNLSDNIVPSEESLLRTVDDLVQEGIKKLGGHDDISLNTVDINLRTRNSNTPVIHYDHASDNAVEAVVSMKETTQVPSSLLDLSMDLFQFGSN